MEYGDGSNWVDSWVSEPRETAERRSAHQQVPAGAGKLHKCVKRRREPEIRQLPRQQTYPAAARVTERQLPDRHDRARQFGGVAQR